MNLLLAFKAEPELSMLVEADWQAAIRDVSGPDSSLMRVVMGNDEQGAAELMLQARDAKAELVLHAATLGDERVIPALRHLAALGFEQQTLLECDGDTRFSAAFVAEQLAGYVQKNGIRLVLLGMQSSEGQNGQAGWLLAEMLGWPCLSQVCELSVEGDGFLVQCETLQQRSQWHVNQPAVLMVQNRGQMALRVPGMRARLAAAKAEVQRQPCESSRPPSLTCLALERLVHHRAGTLINETSSKAAAQRLWHDFLAERIKP